MNRIEGLNVNLDYSENASMKEGRLLKELSTHVEEQAQLHFDKALEESEKVQHLYQYKGLPEVQFESNGIKREINKLIKINFRRKVDSLVNNKKI